MYKTLFSIVVTYSESDDGIVMLRRCLESLHRQSYQNFEILLYHDGPTALPLEGELDLVQYQRLRHIETTAENYGDFGNSLRDIGIRQARGEYVIHLQASDLLYDFALERLVAIMRTPRRDVIVDRRSGQVVDTPPELANMDPHDVFIFAAVMIGKECDGTYYWQDSRHDRRFGMLQSGYPLMAGLIDPMQLIMRRSLWLGYGGWYDKAPDGYVTMYQRFVQENRSRMIPAVLGEHW